MNRDEQRSRVRGLPPRRHRVNEHLVVHPSEPGGGTWISLNDAGVTLALINWYGVAGRVRAEAVSRGQVVMAVRGLTAVGHVQAALGRLPLSRMNPFRLIGIFLAQRRVVEWQWDLHHLQVRRSGWLAQQWISSGYDEPGAQRVRGRIFRQAMHQRSFGTLGWLRRLHRSHRPAAGPFSICMHRPEAATVSYTEVAVTSGRPIMRHLLGNPCQSRAFDRSLGVSTQ